MSICFLFQDIAGSFLIVQPRFIGVLVAGGGSKPPVDGRLVRWLCTFKEHWSLLVNELETVAGSAEKARCFSGNIIILFLLPLGPAPNPERLRAGGVFPLLGYIALSLSS